MVNIVLTMIRFLKQKSAHLALFLLALATFSLGPQKRSFAQVPVRISRHVNTAAHEYLPCPSPQGDKLYFCGMDRTGFFDFKLNFTVNPNSGGEDVFYSVLDHGIWSDARPLKDISTNGHECVTQVLDEGHYVVSGNFPENIGIIDSESGLQTADLFEVQVKEGRSPHIMHYPEPVNSLWTEADGWKHNDLLLFVSDRPTDDPSTYHMKGWHWKGHLWGNTDVYIAIEGDFGWDQVIRLPFPINTDGPERTPRMSADGLQLWVSQWVEGRGLEVMEFRRTEANNWMDWDGPFPLKLVNTELDDWGYIESQNGAFWASALPLRFAPTAPAPGGDAGSFRETNFRTGYSVTGRQSAALNRMTQTDIFWFPNPQNPSHFDVSNVLFKFDSAVLSEEGYAFLEDVSDWCHMNRDLPKLMVTGHTDNVGSSAYNLDLSLRRSKAVANALRSMDVKQEIIAQGLGETNPAQGNESEAGRAANRRVSFEFTQAP
tara:strand:+ start:1224 stop:2684 length:1461 start_codon:yes stop_codon:yes gene_type:complete